MSTKKVKKGPHPHDKKERQRISGCLRCRGRQLMPMLNFTEESVLADIAPLEVLPLSSVPLEAEPVAPLAPGSQSALDAGCSCPVIDNERGRGYHYVPGKEPTYVTVESCQIHGGTTASEAPPAPEGFSPH